MTDAEREEYRALLIEMRESLAAMDASTKEDGAPVELDQQRMGRLSRMDDMQAQAMALALSRRRDIQLQRIAGALERMEAGTYGVCLSCKEAIPDARMAFDPTAFWCAGCAATREKRR